MIDLNSTVSSVAKTISGDIGTVREVLSSNPHLSPFEYPPAVQQAIPIAASLGITIPSAEDLTKLANGEIDKVIGSLGKEASQILDTIDSALGKVTSGAGDAQELLNSLSWLL